MPYEEIGRFVEDGQTVVLEQDGLDVFERYLGGTVRRPARFWGWYSERMWTTMIGTKWYSTPEGGEVEVNAVTRHPYESGLMWPDVVSRGQVGRFLRAGRPAPFHLRTHAKWIPWP